MADVEGRTFEDVHERLSQIVDEVSAEDISLDDALKLYEEAVKLGLIDRIGGLRDALECLYEQIEHVRQADRELVAAAK